MNNIIKKPYEISLWEDKICYAARLLQEVETKLEEEHNKGRYYILNNNTYQVDKESFNKDKTYYSLIPKNETNYKESFEMSELADWLEENKNNPYTIIQFYKEIKLCIIGSDNMTSNVRAFSPKLNRKINGEVSLTFQIQNRFYDYETNDYIVNPFIKLLVNERKIKLRYGAIGEEDTKWYDLIIKNISEDSSTHTFNYTCKSLHINELSKTGFNVELNTELENNMGNVTTLAKTILKDTDWTVEDGDSDILKQYVEEPLYKIVLKENINSFNMETGDALSLEEGSIIYAFYSSINNKDPYFQFLYVEGDYQIDDDSIITNSPNYAIENVEYDVNSDMPTFAESQDISTDYRGKRLVRQLATKFDPILDKYVGIYEKDGERYYGYQETEYFSPTVVTNYVTAPNSYISLSGWTAGAGQENTFATLKNVGFPDIKTPIDQNTEFKSLLEIKTEGEQLIHNSGFIDNKSAIYNSLIKDKEYIFKFLAYNATINNGIIQQLNPISELSKINIKIGTYSLEKGIYIIDDSNLLFNINLATEKIESDYWKVKCLKTITYADLLEDKYGIFISTDGSTIYLEDFQIFEYIEKNDSFYKPNDLPEAVIKTKYYYYPESSYESAEDIVYSYSGYIQQTAYLQIYNDKNKPFEKIRSIEAKESNCFNLIQELNETFECWSIFNIARDMVTGELALDDNYHPIRSISFKEYVGKQNWAGFKRGINLTSTKRTLESDAVISKLIVKNNSNEFGESGFCSIARAKDNPTGENFILDFGYYVRQGLLNFSTVVNDLYLDINGYLGYYKNLRELNANREEIIDILTGLAVENPNYEAAYKAAKNAWDSAENLVLEKRQDLINLTSYTFEQLKKDLANSWWKNEMAYGLLHAITYLTASSQQHKQSYEQYVECYNTSQQLQTEQQKLLDEITKKKQALNLQFYKKYYRFLQEGTWIEEKYTDDNLYFLDAQSVAKTSTSPKVSYTINVLELSQLPGYENYKFDLGDISYIEDTEFFGWAPDGITPYHEKIVISEDTIALDSPEQNSLKIQNYKTQFEDLFQRITATTQNLEYHSGDYARAAGVIQNDGTIKFESLQNSILSNSLVLANARDQSVIIDDYGITTTNMVHPNEIVRIVSGGILITNNGGETWSTGITGNGINANYITSGTLNTSAIHIMSNGFPSFRWDSFGISAYEFSVDESNQPYAFNNNRFVRMDQYGLYGISGEDALEFQPKNVDDVWDSEALRFGLTWKGFKLKSDGTNGYISITSDNDFQTVANGLERIKIGRLGEQSYQKVYIDENSFVPGVYYYFDLETFAYQVAQEYIENQAYYKRYDEKYGIRISDANGAPVMETGDDGELWLKKALQVDAHKGKVSIGHISDFEDDIHGSQVINASSESGSFIVYEDGYLMTSGGTFEGEIIANSGSIGGINITEKGLDVINGSITIYKDVYVLDDTVTSETFGNNIYYYKNDNDYVVAEEFVEETDYYVKQQNAVLSQDEEGNLTMTGTIYAQDGSFSGTVNATAGSFTGNINAQGGNIGGFTIESEQLYSNNISYDDKSNPINGILLNGVTGQAYFNNVTLGSGLVIQDYIKLGEAYIYNPGVNGDKFIKTGNISIDQNGLMNIGKIEVYGGTNANDSYIKGGDYSNSNGGWIIQSDGKAYFRDIYVDDAHIRNSVLEIGTVQSVGSLMLFEDCYSINSISDDKTVLTLNSLASFNVNDWIYCDEKYYQIISVENDINNKITTIGLTSSFYGTINSVIAKFGTSGVDSIFSVWGANATEENKGMYPFAHNNAIALSEFTEKDGAFSYEKRLVLGNLNNLKIENQEISGYGLYADNVYLNGALTTKAGSGDLATYAGINTLSGVAFNKDDSGSDKSKVIFWAGSGSTKTPDIQDAPFQVTEAGTVYASKAIFENSVFAGGAISGADLYAARIHGWSSDNERSAALTIFDTTTGISFKTGYNYEEKTDEGAEETFSISHDGFKVNQKNFIRIPSGHGYDAKVDFVGNLETNLITATKDNNSIRIEAENTQAVGDFYIGEENSHQMQYKQIAGENGGYDLYVI